MYRITVEFDVTASSFIQAWMSIQRIFASLSLPAHIKMVKEGQ